MTTADSHGVKVAALVPAAGQGVRLGAGMPKALVRVRGESLLLRAVRGLLDSGRVECVVVAAPADQVSVVEGELASLNSRVLVVPGGTDRTDSVRRALTEAERAVPDAGIILVHDAARAFTPVPIIRDVVRAVERGASAVIPVLPVSDTIKEVDASETVTATVDRSRLRAVQTPQGFAVHVLRKAYAAAADATTDDAGLVERVGEPVRTVAGHANSLKITTAFDLAVAEAVLPEPVGREVEEQDSDGGGADQAMVDGRTGEHA